MGLTSLTVFVVADDDHGTQLRETFVRWSAEHLVGRSAWVTPASTQISDFGPPLVQTQIIDDGEIQTEDLFRFIGKYRLNVVRVVLGQIFVDNNAPVDTDLHQTAVSIADAIDRALPRSVREDGHSTELWRINLVAPVSGVRSVHPGTLLQGWNVNAIVSAEDRPDADHANVFVRSPGNAVGHAAAALAAAGGVFSGVEPGMFDALAETQSTSNGRELLVVRVAARAIVGDDAETRLAVQTLEAVEAEPMGASAFVEWGRTASNPDRLVGDLHRYLIGRDPWTSVGSVQAPRYTQRQKSFKAASGEAVRFDLKMFAVVPGWVVRRGKAKLEDIATDAIVGQGADTLVRFNPSTPEGMKNSATVRLHQVEDQALKNEIERASESVATPDPSVWARLRSVAFAAVDGGELPDDFGAPRYAGVREVLPAGRVVPDPRDTFSARGRSVSPADVAAARCLGAELDEDLQRRSQELATLQSALDQAEAAVGNAAEALELANAKLDGAGASEEGRAEPAAAQSRAKRAREDSAETATNGLLDARAAQSKAKRALFKAESARDGARASTDRVKKDADALGAEHAAFAQWAQRNGDSVVFRLIDDVAKRRDAFGETHDTVRAELKVETPANNDLVVAQRTLLRWWRVTVLTWLVLLLSVGATFLLLHRLPEEGPGSLETLPGVLVWFHENWYWVLLGLTVIALAVLWCANHAYYRANRRYLWNVQSVADARVQMSEDVVYTGREAARLGHLSTALRDWASIIGCVLHHPHGAVADLTRDVEASVVDTLPAAFAIARISDEDEIPKQTIVQAARLLHPPGWAASAFDHAYAVHQLDMLSNDPAGLIAADLDESDSTYGPRHELQQFWAGSGAAEVVTAEAVDELRQAVHDGQIQLNTRRVTRLGEYSTGDVVTEPDFYRGVATADTAFVGDMFTEAARVEGKRSVHQTVMWLPTGAGRRAVDDSNRLQVGTESVAVRVDISRLLTTDDLVMFSTGRAADDLPSAAGQPVRSPAGGIHRDDADVWA